MKNKLKLLITILVLFSMSTYSSVTAVAPNYFDATIKMKQLTLFDDGDLIGKGEIYYKIINRAGVTLLNTRNYYESLGTGLHTNIIGETYTCEHYIPGFDYFIVEVWDRDTWDDDCLFRAKLEIKIKSTTGIVSYLKSNNLWLCNWPTYLVPPIGYWISVNNADRDRTYAHFQVYNCQPPNVIDPYNILWIEVTIDYYYSRFI